MIVLPHLGLGGAQRVASCMAAHWVDSGHDVTVLTTLEKPPDFYKLHPRIKRMRLTEQIGRWARLDRYVTGRLERAVTSRSKPRASSPIRYPRKVKVKQGTEIRDGMVVAARHGYLLLRRLFSERMKRAILAFCARYRLLGSSGYPYARFLRFSTWRVRSLHKVFAEIQPDVVISLLGATNIVTLAASRGLPHRTVISERNDPRKQKLQSPWEELRPILYRVSDVVSANSRGALESMRAYCTDAKLCYVPNPLIFGDRCEDSKRSNAVLFLGRLVHQKAPDILIEAFAKFAHITPGWSLQIAGDGPMAEELQTRVHDLGLSDDVKFHGAVDNPSPLLVACKIFVLPSRFEGTPNALLEAMAHRMPCIVSDASPGPLKLIADGSSGLVVQAECVESLATAMGRLALNNRLRLALGEAAFERVQEFGLDRVAPMWDQILFPDDALGRNVV